MPYLEDIYTAKEISAITKRHAEVKETFNALREKGELIKYIQSPTTQKTFEIGPGISVDFRITDSILPEYQDKPVDCDIFTRTPMDQKMSPL
jgi:hypothetical protein